MLTSSQCEALRRLVPEQKRPSNDRQTTAEDLSTVSVNGRNLVDWIEDTRRPEDQGHDQTLASIRDAEFAAFKLRERLKSKRPLDDQIGPRSSGYDSPANGSHKQGKRISFTDLEHDHTVARRPGELGCPFAGVRQKPESKGQGSASRHNLPTPRSSGSNLSVNAPASRSVNASRSRRPSSNDPIRPSLSCQAPSDDAASDAGSDNGPACPIRFLDQHSPEDIAQYFEEHKDELPRSHEACIKRFQSNADSIKELDAKYGSIVTMIQGLGQKHQPMLPETKPMSEGPPASQREDSKGARKIQKWAKAVSEVPPRDAGNGRNEDDREAKARARSEGADEDRQGHFDRPLKEIRVGESPSRPWGVPIPSKYLDRAEAAQEEDSAVAVADEDEQSKPVIGADQPSAQSQGQIRAIPARFRDGEAKGKCPFGHGAAASPAAKERPSSSPAHGPLKGLAQGVSMQQPPPGRDREQPVSTQVEIRADGHGKTGSRIVNHGLALVANRDVLGTGTFENRGTLVFGYSASEAHQIARDFPRNM